MSDSGNAIEVEDLAKRFGEVQAVAGLSFAVGQGEVFGFLGPNGAGKTTTINMLTGLARTDAGRIRIAGIDCSKNPKAAQHLMGVVPDESNLYPELSGLENLAFCGSLYGMIGPNRHTVGRSNPTPIWVNPVSTPTTSLANFTTAAASDSELPTRLTTLPRIASRTRRSASRSPGPPRITVVSPSSASRRSTRSAQRSSNQCFQSFVVKGQITAYPAVSPSRAIKPRADSSSARLSAMSNRKSLTSRPSSSARKRYDELIP